MQKVVERPKSPQIKSEIVDVTPGIAASWLDRNVANRKPRATAVDAYARAMMDDRWALSGDAIRFDVNGNLMDGQHRLLACVKADVSFRTFVLYNVPDAARHTIDTNVGRSVADTLTLDGVKCATATAATVRWLVNAKRGVATARESGSTKIKITTQEVETVLHNHPNLNVCVRRVANLSPRVRGAAVAPLAWILRN